MRRPIDTARERLEGVQGSAEKFTARCPAHDDRHNSLSVSEGRDGRVLIKCFAGCTFADVAGAMGLEEKDFFAGECSRANNEPLQLEDLARAKGLSVDFLQRLCVRQWRAGVIITYYLEDGSKADRQRLRTDVSAKRGSRWTKGEADPVPYGLWMLDRVRREGYLILVEGESDCWTLWHHGFPTLGVPGANMADKLKAEHVAGLKRIYVVQEPDRGGQTFIEGAAQRLQDLGFPGMVYAVAMERGCKDPNALHKQDPDVFKTVWQRRMDESLPLTAYTLEAFIGELKGLSKDEAEALALDRIELCATMPKADQVRAENMLKLAGCTYAFLRSWRAGVRDEAKTLQDRAAERQTQKKQPITVELADAILSEFDYARDAGEHLYVYMAGTYRRGGKEHIEEQVKLLLAEWDKLDEWSSYRASEVVKYIQADRPYLWEGPPADRINLLNGILHLETKQLEPHSPAYLFPVQLPVQYDPEATCPEWETFVDTTLPEDAAAAGVAWQLAAWLIDPASSIQKALLLLGDGGNGKSRFLMGLRALIGGENTTDMSLHFLESNRFATGGLHGMLANICPDLPSGHLAETSVFKALTGGDRIHAEYKHGKTFSFPAYCKLFFSANHAPRSSDSSEGFYRRWLVIPFNRTFTGAKRRPAAELDAALAAEVSGLLNKALEWLPQVRQRGITVAASMAAAHGEFRQVTDPFSVWADDNLVELPDAYVPCEDLRRIYNKAAKAEGWSPMNKQTFGRRIREQYPKMERREKTLQSERTMCYVGIGLREKYQNPTDPMDNSFPHGKRNGNVCEGGHTQNGSYLEKGGQYPSDPMGGISAGSTVDTPDGQRGTVHSIAGDRAWVHINPARPAVSYLVSMLTPAQPSR